MDLLENWKTVFRERLSKETPFIFARFFRGMALLPPLANIKHVI